MSDNVIRESDTVRLAITWPNLETQLPATYAISGSELRNGSWGLDYLISSWIDKASNDIHLNGLTEKTPLIVFKYMRIMLEQAFIQSLQTEWTLKVTEEHSVRVKIGIESDVRH